MIDETTSILTDFMETSDVDYAYMLDGSWGSGKTYYIKQFISNAADNKRDNIFFYSLNGKSNISEIIRSITLLFVFKNRVNDKKYRIYQDSIEILSDAKDNTIGIAAKTLNKLNDRILDKLFGKQVKDKSLLIIDDLERSSMYLNVLELLGRVHNSFVERHVKVLYLCDESRIKKDEPTYNEAKEKYIRRTVAFKPTRSEIIATLVERSRIGKATLVRAVSASVYHDEVPINFRTVKFNLDVVSSLEKIYTENTSIPMKPLDQLLYSIGILCKYVSLGKIDRKEYRLLNTLHYDISMSEMISKKKAETDTWWSVFYRETMDRKFGHFDLPSSVIDFIVVGNLDKHRITEELRIDKTQKTTTETLLDKLSNFRGMETGDLKPLVEKLLSDLKTKQFEIGQLRFVDFQIRAFRQLGLIDLGEDAIFDLYKEIIDSRKEELSDQPQKRLGTLDIQFQEPGKLREYLKSTLEALVEDTWRDLANELCDAILVGNLDDFLTLFSESDRLRFFDLLVRTGGYSRLVRLKNASLRILNVVLNELFLRYSDVSFNHSDLEKTALVTLRNHFQSDFEGIDKSDLLKVDCYSELLRNIEGSISRIR